MNCKATLMKMTIAITVAMSGCGSNIYAPLQSQDPADEAARYLEQGKPQKAIDLLEEALADDEGNATYISMLALSYAQRAGVAPIDFVENMGSVDSSGGSGGNGITALFSVTPAATTSAIEDVDYAITLMGQLPADALSDAEKLKLSIFQTASTVLKIKILDTDGDGTVSTSEMLNLTDATAESIVLGLINASSLLSGGGASASSGGDAAASLISGMVSGINGQSGSTSKDKLAGYLSS